jgi:hypothetical protein
MSSFQRLVTTLAARKAWEAENNTPLCACHGQGLADAWTEAMREDAQREVAKERAQALARSQVSIPDWLKRIGVPLPVLERIRNPEDTPSMRAARRYFEPDAPRWLVLLGKTSTGKTLAAAWVLGQYLARHTAWSTPTGYGQRPEVALFTPAFEFTGASDYAEKDRAWLERIQKCGLLVLDDLGSERLGEVELGMVQRLLMSRHANGLRTIITSNLSAETLTERYGERIAERIREVGRVVDAGKVGLRGKRAPAKREGA